jgi:hypothetical protein
MPQIDRRPSLCRLRFLLNVQLFICWPAGMLAGRLFRVRILDWSFSQMSFSQKRISASSPPGFQGALNPIVSNIRYISHP